MERDTWTDERLDDMVARHESQFELLRGEIRATRTELRAEIGDVRTEMQSGFGEIRVELSKLHRDILHLTIGMIAAFAALFAALAAIALG